MGDQAYRFEAPAFEITKSYRDENGQMFIEGLASTVAIDQTGERMSPEAIAKMAARLVGKPLREEHQKGYLNKLGEIVKADVLPDDQGRPSLWIKARLYDWSTAARDTWAAIKGGVKLGLSVAGKIAPGGRVKELVESVGKYIPTYKDIEPTEVSVTDHPANLDTFALAVSKSLDEAAYQKAVTNAHDSRPAEYEDVATGDFLDAENFKYPADDKHLMPALRYFNQSGQRGKGGYSPDKWAQMGRKLAAKLSKKTGDTYHYDPESETVTKEPKSTTAKEVNTMESQLVSKKIDPAVAGFVKEWKGNTQGLEVRKTDEPKEEEKKEEAPAEAPAAETPAADAPAAEAPAEAPADAPAPEAEATEKAAPAASSVSTDSSIESLLSTIASSLSDIKSSLSTSSTSTATSAAKAAPSSTSDSDMTETMTSVSRALDSLKALIAKRKATTTTAPASPSSPSTSTTTEGPMSKALTEIVSTLQEVAKHVTQQDEVLKQLTTKLEEAPAARKGYAVTLQKNFAGHHDEPAEFDKNVLDKLVSDKRSSFKDVMTYKTTHELPTWFKAEAAN